MRKQGKIAVIHLWLPADLKRKFRVACAQRGKTMQEVLAQYAVKYSEE